MNSNFARCELCHKYCGNKNHKARLFVEIPPYLQEKLDKSHAWLCFECVKEHCKDTIGNIKYDDCEPMKDDCGNIMRTTYWKDLIFGGK